MPASRGQEDEPRRLQHEGPDVHPPQRGHERDEQHDADADRVHREHRAPAVPSPDQPRDQRSGDERRREPEHEDAPDRGRAPREVQDQRDERDRPEPVAQGRDGLADHQAAKATVGEELAHAVSPTSGAPRPSSARSANPRTARATPGSRRPPTCGTRAARAPRSQTRATDGGTRRATDGPVGAGVLPRPVPTHSSHPSHHRVSSRSFARTRRRVRVRVRAIATDEEDRFMGFAVIRWLRCGRPGVALVCPTCRHARCN